MDSADNETLTWKPFDAHFRKSQALRSFWNNLSNSGKELGLKIRRGKMEFMRNEYCLEFNKKLGNLNLELGGAHVHLG